MSVTLKFIKIAAGITGIAIGSPQESVVLEISNTHLYCTSKKSLIAAAASGASIRTSGPSRTSLGANIHLPRHASWHLDPWSSVILATRAASSFANDKHPKVDAISCEGTRIQTISLNMQHIRPAGASNSIRPPHPKLLKSPALPQASQDGSVFKVVSNSDRSALLCIDDMPDKIDSQTRVALEFPKKKAMKLSSQIKTSDLAINAAWNNSAQKFVIIDEMSQKLYSWSIEESDTRALDGPRLQNNQDAVYSIDPLGRYIFALVSDSASSAQSLHLGHIAQEGISWLHPISLRSGEYQAVSISPSGEKIALLGKEQGLEDFAVTVFNIKGREIERTYVPADSAAFAMGWISDTEIVVAGTTGLLLLNYAFEKGSSLN